MRPNSGQKKITKYFLRTGNLGFLGTKQKTNLFTEVTKCCRGKLYSFETEIDAQACNVS